MLKLIRHMKDLDFSQLLQVYRGSVHSRYAEDSLYDYLLSLFSCGGACAVWIHEGVYVSSLRLEPFEDGFLIAGLETTPEERGQGHATMLLRSLCGSVIPDTAVALYSHVRYSNRASLKVHEKSGFVPILDHAVFLDGSVDTHSRTLYKEL